MTKRTLSHIAAISILFVTLFSQAGCRENTIINTNITPAGDSLAIVGETVELTAKTVYSYFQTNFYTTGQQVIMGLGVINNDPEIGNTNASFYMQVVPKQSSGYVPPSVIDSVVVVLPYSKFTYGDTSNAAANTYRVYAVTDDNFKLGEAYYDSTYKTYDSLVELGSATVSLATIKDSVTVGDVAAKVLPHLRIKLTDTGLIMSKLRNANYNSYADFVTSFKGLYIKASNLGPENTIPYFRLSENASGNNYSRAGILVYYHDTTSVLAKADVFGFNPDNCAFFNRIHTDVSGSNAAVDTANYLFLQSRPGLSTEITTRDVALLPNRIVNKCEIVITEVASTEASKYFKPEWLYPYKIGTDGALQTIEDAVFTSPSGTSVSGLAFINGKARQVTINGNTYNQYVINCPREFQKALLEKRDMTLRITGVTNGYIGAFRLRAGKKNNPIDPAFNIRMNVVYSGVQ